MTALSATAERATGAGAEDELVDAIAMPLIIVQMTLATSLVLSGSTIALPLMPIGATLPDPRTASGSRIDEPDTYLGVLTQAPDLRSGSCVDQPLQTPQLVVPPPSMLSGSLVEHPVSITQVRGPAASVSAGAFVSLPADEMSVMTHDPTVLAGNTVYVERRIGVSSSTAGTAGAAVADHATGAGAELARIVDGSDVLSVIVPPLEIRSGSRVDMPVSGLALVCSIPEIQARSRRVAVRAIAS